MKNAWRSLTAVCALVIGLYAYMARPSGWESLSRNPADANYNLLVQGFRAGQLSLRKEVPPGFAQLADPYDPVANARYRFWPNRLHDLSYYKSRLYLSWGVTPALILFWPFVALTGHYLVHSRAVVFFCTMGFLVSVGLLRALWQRYFAEVSTWVVVACALALGLAAGVPVLLSRCEVYEVAISCGYMLTMVALAAIWCALHEPERRSRWLAAASVAYGLAIGARPSMLLGAIILLVPVIHTWRERRQVWAMLIAATVPIALIGLGLMLYNARRFDSPFEFGQHYQLAVERQPIMQLFSLRYLWFNFRVCFWEPARWSTHFPFVHDIVVPPVPPGHGGAEKAFGIATNVPLAWLALAAPLAWRRRSAEAGSVLRRFVMAVALLFGACALTLGFFRGAVFRYEVDFLPALLLLAVVGILGLERALANRPLRRRAVRWGWGLLLAFSVAFNLLASVEDYPEAHYRQGVAFWQVGKGPQAMEQWEQALRIKPDYAEAHNSLGVALTQVGRTEEAITHLNEALRIKPDFADAHYNLAGALIQVGRVEEGIGHYEQVLRSKPDDAEVHYNLAGALMRLGKVAEAIGHYEQALRIRPDYAEAQRDLVQARALR